MSVINNNPFGSAPPGFSELDFGGAPGAGAYTNPQTPSDTVRYPYPPLAPPTIPPTVGGSCAGAPAGASNEAPASFSSILNQISSAISSLFAQLGSALGAATQGTAPAAAAGTETAFADATASSKGDPHLAFDGTTQAGSNDAGHWDSMHAHADLLDSDSFSGGYRVATQVTQPNAKGVTLNAKASITTANGATSVSMRAGGSYEIESNGENVTLQQGRTTSLGNGETVLLNADGSLTVSDANGSGGTLVTTLAANRDGGVDVETSAHDVDLGGYLVNHNTVAANPPAPQQLSLSQTPATWPQTPATFDFEQYDPDAFETSLQNITS
jgi:hypothetical protein